MSGAVVLQLNDAVFPRLDNQVVELRVADHAPLPLATGALVRVAC